jgi:hypothetical protein
LTPAVRRPAPALDDLPREGDMKATVLFLLSLHVFTVNTLAQAALPTFDAYAVEEEGEYFPEECSFYCANFSHTEGASSNLPRRDRLRYDAGRAHDRDLNTAWVEGGEGDGVGEFLEYTIDTSKHQGDSLLKVTGLRIYNGYRKSKELWQDNSRVKRLKMYVNGKPYAIISLKDAYNCQTVELGTVELKPEKTMLKFEIMEVYKGRKYSDTAITEIELDGCCAH